LEAVGPPATQLFSHNIHVFLHFRQLFVSDVHIEISCMYLMKHNVVHPKGSQRSIDIPMISPKFLGLAGLQESAFAPGGLLHSGDAGAAH
jgi:hypothetical protein